MFERFTTPARDAVVQAQTEAGELDSPVIGSQHLLLGTLWNIDGPIQRLLGEEGLTYRAIRDRIAGFDVEDDSGVSDAEALGRIGIDLSTVRRRVEATFGVGALDARRGRRGRRGRGHIPFDRSAKKALELALREALHLGHNEIAADHLLLGLTRLDHTTATSMMELVGIEPAALHHRIETMLRDAA